MIFMGIDPGKSGGIGMVEGAQAVAYKMPATARDILDTINVGQGLIVLEKVSAGPKMGSSAAFKFGASFGALHMAAVSVGCRLELVSPQRWQKEFSLIQKGRGLGQDDTSKKNRNKAKAQELFPGLKITHAIADALLLAEYGRRVFG